VVINWTMSVGDTAGTKTPSTRLRRCPKCAHSCRNIGRDLSSQASGRRCGT
jgi:hypothetical protein